MPSKGTPTLPGQLIHDDILAELYGMQTPSISDLLSLHGNNHDALCCPYKAQVYAIGNCI